MPARDLHVLTSDSAVEKACREAAAKAGAAVAAVAVHADPAALLAIANDMFDAAAPGYTGSKCLRMQDSLMKTSSCMEKKLTGVIVSKKQDGSVSFPRAARSFTFTAPAAKQESVLWSYSAGPAYYTS